MQFSRVRCGCPQFERGSCHIIVDDGHGGVIIRLLFMLDDTSYGLVDPQSAPPALYKSNAQPAEWQTICLLFEDGRGW